MPELYAFFAIPIRLPHHTKVRPPAWHPHVTRYSCPWVKWGRFDSHGREVLSGDFLLQKSLSSGSGDRRFRRKRKRGFMDSTACWACDMGVQFHLFLVVAGPSLPGML